MRTNIDKDEARMLTGSLREALELLAEKRNLGDPDGDDFLIPDEESVAKAEAILMSSLKHILGAEV